MKIVRFVTVVAVSTLWLSSVALTGCKDEVPVERTEIELRDDDLLIEQVKIALQNSPSFKFPDVLVTSFKGTVQLSGFVLTEDQKGSAENIAKGVTGVRSVENKISVKH